MTTSQPPNTNPSRVIPLTCSGHTRPVVHLQFSPISDGTYYLISACKGITLLVFSFRIKKCYVNKELFNAYNRMLPQMEILCFEMVQRVIG